MQTVSVTKGAWIETLFDPGHPNVYLITIPALALFALGIRRGAAIYLFLSIIVLFLKNNV